MNINNIFDYTVNDCGSDRLFYCISKEKLGNTLNMIAYKNDKIYSISNEWLYLIKNYYDQENRPIMYEKVVELYYKIKNNINIKNFEIIPFHTISFISSFSNGTSHGYTGIYSFLIEYEKNYDKYKNYKIALYKNSQKGIIDIVENFLIKKKFNSKEELLVILLKN